MPGQGWRNKTQGRASMVDAHLDGAGSTAGPLSPGWVPLVGAETDAPRPPACPGAATPAKTGASACLCNRKNGSFSKTFADAIATVAAHNVARRAVPTIAVGRTEPAAARSAIAVVGINCTDAVFIA